MDVAGSTLRWQRAAVAVAVAGSALALYKASGDIFGLPKATLVVLCALVCMVVGACRAVHARQVLVPTAPVTMVAGAFLLALGITTLTSTTPMQSFVGEYSQYAGFSVYAACVVVFLTVVRAHVVRTLPGLVLVFVASGALVTIYGLVQWAGWDPVDWNMSGQVISTMGNPNFLAGWVGLVLPLCLAVAIAPLSGPWRLVGGLTALGICPIAVATDSFQGPATVAASGVGFVVLLVACGGLRLPGWLRGRRGAAVALVVVVLAVPVLVKVLGDGIEQGLLERRHFWHVAVEVFEDHPLVGAGPDTFHNQYLPRRPAAHAAIPFSKNAGAAHDVPLDLLAGGGVLLGGSYLAFVAVVGWRLVVAVRRRSAPAWLVAGIGAAWLGYQVQSLVSIDKPSLVVAHWVLAGAVVVLSGPVPFRAVDLPGRSPQRRQAAVSTVVSIGVLAVLGLVAGWVATRPFRADLAAIAGRAAIARSDGDAAEADLARARRLAPWEATYTYDQVRLYGLADHAKEAVAAAEDGARLEPGDSSYALVAARVSDVVDDHARATRWYDEALRRDPYGLDALLSAALSAAKAGESRRVQSLTRRALAVSHERADVWARVGDARSALRDVRSARTAYRRALVIDPTNALAERGLAQLDR